MIENQDQLDPVQQMLTDFINHRLTINIPQLEKQIKQLESQLDEMRKTLVSEKENVSLALQALNDYNIIKENRLKKVKDAHQNVPDNYDKMTLGELLQEQVDANTAKDGPRPAVTSVGTLDLNEYIAAGRLAQALGPTCDIGEILDTIEGPIYLPFDPNEEILDDLLDTNK